MDSENEIAEVKENMDPANGCINDADSLNEDLDTIHFRRVTNAYKHYRNNSVTRIKKSMKSLASLPEHHQSLLTNYKDHLDNLMLAVDQNFNIIKMIVKDVEQIFENVPIVRADNPLKSQVNQSDIDKVQSILKQIVRDWSTDGQVERDACYEPIIKEVLHRFPVNKYDAKNVNILVPGAGLGRLAFELARRGYSCQGNEYSLFMLFASNFVLNKCKGVNMYKIFPWAHQFCNNFSYNDQIRSIIFPDVDPTDLPNETKFSMAAGDFQEIYTEKDSWDCIASCFFIDTASNICQYIDIIWKILKPGGFWINLGPLLYHFSDLENENSIEPSYEDVREIILSYGFEMLKENINVKTTYAENPNSMMKYAYNSVFFVCRKPFEEELDCNSFHEANS
ncbi:Carnosine N-methyltransferase [Nymphon striatum]|nr:Carnosine N-methyltransferase [Nymphon striatum]